MSRDNPLVGVTVGLARKILHTFYPSITGEITSVMERQHIDVIRRRRIQLSNPSEQLNSTWATLFSVECGDRMYLFYSRSDQAEKLTAGRYATIQPGRNRGIYTESVLIPQRGDDKRVRHTIEYQEAKRIRLL